MDDAPSNLNKSIESTIEKDESKFILLDMVVFDVSIRKRKIIRFFLKYLGIHFKEDAYVSSAQESPYNKAFEADMKKSEDAFNRMKFREITDLKDLWKVKK